MITTIITSRMTPVHIPAWNISPIILQPVNVSIRNAIKDAKSIWEAFIIVIISEFLEFSIKTNILKELFH
jgi:hypothetical protein